MSTSCHGYSPSFVIVTDDSETRKRGPRNSQSTSPDPLILLESSPTPYLSWQLSFPCALGHEAKWRIKKSKRWPEVHFCYLPEIPSCKWLNVNCLFRMLSKVFFSVVCAYIWLAIPTRGRNFEQTRLREKRGRRIQYIKCNPHLSKMKQELCRLTWWSTCYIPCWWGHLSNVNFIQKCTDKRRGWNLVTFVLQPVLIQIFLKCQYRFQIETQIVSTSVWQRIELHSRKMKLQNV